MLTGSIVAIVTPMHGNGDIDYPTFEKLLDWQVEQGTSGIVVLGTTGESPTITADEKKKLIELAVKAVDGRVPVIIGTGTNATQASIYNTQQAKDLGADMCLTVAPYYNKPTQDGLFAHFSAIADAVDLSQIIYNHTGRCVIDIAPEVTARLSQHKKYCGYKRRLC